VTERNLLLYKRKKGRIEHIGVDVDPWLTLFFTFSIFSQTVEAKEEATDGSERSPWEEATDGIEW
jgi:hypothetical protein